MVELIKTEALLSQNNATVLNNIYLVTIVYCFGQPSHPMGWEHFKCGQHPWVIWQQQLPMSPCYCCFLQYRINITKHFAIVQHIVTVTPHYKYSLLILSQTYILLSNLTNFVLKNSEILSFQWVKLSIFSRNPILLYILLL